MNTYLKSLIFLVIFSILHVGYEITSWHFLKPICGIDESLFQHLKIAFWAYFITTLIEYLIVKRSHKARKNFWFPRILSTTIVPWLILLIWYLVPAFVGRVESFMLELFWGVFVTILAGIVGPIIEKNIDGKDFTLRFKIVIVILFIVSGFLYIWFTFKPPWIDLFVNPANIG